MIIIKFWGASGHFRFDQYRFALNLAKGEDVEIVGMVQTKIAKLYLKVYSDGIHKTKAREILTEVMNFPGIIGRNMYEADWYKEPPSCCVISTRLLRPKKILSGRTRERQCWRVSQLS